MFDCLFVCLFSSEQVNCCACFFLEGITGLICVFVSVVKSSSLQLSSSLQNKITPRWMLACVISSVSIEPKCVRHYLVRPEAGLSEA